MPLSRSPTVNDVARAAGVSTATVSRALNKPGTVRPELRARVQSAVDRLGYMAHAGARALSLRRSGTVGVIVPTIDNAIFARGLQAFQQHETEKATQPLLAGPFKPLLAALHRLQQAGTPTMRIRTALVTARSAPAHERAIRCLLYTSDAADE